MGNGNYFYPLNESDEYQNMIVSLPNPNYPDSADRLMFKLGQIASGIYSCFSNIRIDKNGNCVSINKDINKDNWKNCEILQPGKRWQTGKMRLRVVIEFCPDAPESDRELESLLDDIHQETMVNSFYPLNANREYQDMVISFPNPDESYGPIFKLNQIQETINENVNIRIGCSNQGYIYIKNEWIHPGQDCEILKPGQYWEQGKMRLRFVIEFCPDEPEGDPDSPLDDIRQMSDDS